MRLPCSVARQPVGMNMTPMIDVVFLLIIFFLVSSHLAQRETRVPLELPVASSVQPPRPSAQRLVLNLLPDGQLVVGGRQVTIEQLPQLLRPAVRTQYDQREIQIRGDRRTPYRDVAPILQAIAAARIGQVTFVVSQR